MHDTIDPDASPPHRLIRLNTVMEWTGMKRAYLYNEMAQRPPRFPRPIKIGRASLWEARSVQTWIKKRIDENNPR